MFFTRFPVIFMTLCLFATACSEKPEELDPQGLGVEEESNSNSGEDLSPSHASDKTTVVEDMVFRWSEYCRSHSLSDDLHAQGIELIQRGLERYDQSYLSSVSDEFHILAISQFSSYSSSGAIERIPFLFVCLDYGLANQRSHEANPSVSSQHTEAIRGLTESINQNLHASIAGRPGFDSIIEAEVQRAFNRLTSKVAEMRDTSICPAFKRDWSAQELEFITARIEERAQADPFLNSGGGESQYRELLRRQANTLINGHLEFLTFLDLAPLLTSDEVQVFFRWSTKNQRALMFDGSRRWPLIVFLAPK